MERRPRAGQFIAIFHIKGKGVVMTKKIFGFVFILCLSFFSFYCEKRDVKKTYTYNLTQKQELGKRLFFDKNLSTPIGQFRFYWCR